MIDKDERLAVVIDADLARRLAKIVRYAVTVEQMLGWSVPDWKRTANELHDALVVAGVESVKQ